MNPREIGHLSEDPLFSLQLRVARRADELRRNPQVSPSLNLHCWLLAESEIFAGLADERYVAHESSPPSAAGPETSGTRATAVIEH